LLAKKTSKNQITLPKKVLEGLPETDYFDVSVRESEIVLRPVTITPAGSTLKAVREKIKSLGLTEKDVKDAVEWARRR
jgi:hypothetical protein